MVKPIDTNAIAKATGRPWGEWIAWLDARAGEAKTHTEIAALVKADTEVDGWWAQSITVAYEQAIGRRKPGQLSDGSFSASVSRVVPGDPARLHKAWCLSSAKLKALAGVAVAGAATQSVTPKRHYWRASFADGSRVTMAFETKNAGKTLVSVEHGKLARAERLEAVKEAWREILIDCIGES